MGKVIKVTRAEVAAARANVAAMRRLGREPDPRIVQIANARRRPAPGDRADQDSAQTTAADEDGGRAATPNP